MLTKKEIIEALEQSDHIFPTIPGLNEYVEFDNLVAGVTDSSNPFANRVCCAKLSERNADTVIEKMIEYYSTQKKGFIWIVGPNSSPSDLGRRLELRQLDKLPLSYGMYIDSKDFKSKTVTDIEIKEIPLNDLDSVNETFADGFNMSIFDARECHRRIQMVGDKITTKVYLALKEGIDRPLGCCYLTYFSDKPFALLGGAATLEDFRGQGIYTAMLNCRIKQAEEDGKTNIIVIANKETSAPICQKYGFLKICEFEYFRFDYK